ncbi:MAG: hypothetical protein U0169_03195 [Polyangiaceae bacterium]
MSLAGDFGDLRAAPSIVPLLVARSAGLRRAAVSALGRLRDAHVLAHAATLAADPSADVRVAYARATVDLGVPDVRSITKLVADDDTVSAAVDLARSVDHPDVARALAARAKVSTDAELRGRAFGALASQSNVTAVEVLEAFAVTDADPYPSAFALARSASPLAARVLARTAGRVTGVARRHALRACLVRRLDGRDPCPDLDRLVDALARSNDVVDEDLAAFARVTMAPGSSFAAPAGATASVKRSVAPFVLIAGKEAVGAMRATWRSEPDASTRHALGVAFVPLADGEVDRDVPSSTLRARVDEASVDLAALAPHALARSVGAEDRATRLLDAPDPAVRFAAYRGLAFASFPSATGRLADALVKETDVRARRLLVRALVARGVGPTVAPIRSDVLALVRETDPDPTVRTWATPSGSPDADVLRARRALVCGGGNDVAWVHVTDGREPRGTGPIEGTLRTSDGCAYPVVFDADGDAIVPGIPGGDVEVVLAPVFPTYDSRDHDGRRQGRDGEETIHR